MEDKIARFKWTADKIFHAIQRHKKDEFIERKFP
jgi:hypothetical protein